MIITNVDVITFVCAWLMAYVAYPGVSLEDDGPAGVPVGGEPVFSRFSLVGPAVSLMLEAAPHVGRVLRASRLEAGGGCEWHGAALCCVDG